MKSRMLWLAADLRNLPLEALSQEVSQRHTDYVVTQSRGSRRWVIASSNPQITAGLDLNLARMRRPHLMAVERQPTRELQALETLACAAYGFGDRITFRIDEPAPDFASPRCTLWVEIGTSLKLFGGLDRLLDKIEREFASLEHCASFGVAPTLEAAAALARHGAPPVCSFDELPDALTSLPLAALSLDAGTRDLLADSGLRLTGEVLLLPRKALTQRIGGAAMTYLDRLTGAAPDLLRWYRPPAFFSRWLDFEIEIEDSERLAFPLRRLLGELACYLRARATGVQQFHFEITHARSDGREHPPTRIAMNLSSPSRDEGLILRVTRERLGTVTMPAPARTLSLIAKHFAAPAGSQQDLFDSRARSDEDAAAVIDRLMAKLGTAAIWRPAVVDDHRPEKAWRAMPLDRIPSGENADLNARPALLLRHPQRLQRPPSIIGDVERIAGGWWDEFDLQRDYFCCELDQGVRGWAYLDRGDGQLYLHGIWA